MLFKHAFTESQIDLVMLSLSADVVTNIKDTRY